MPYSLFSFCLSFPNRCRVLSIAAGVSTVMERSIDLSRLADALPQGEGSEAGDVERGSKDGQDRRASGRGDYLTHVESTASGAGGAYE